MCGAAVRKDYMVTPHNTVTLATHFFLPSKSILVVCIVSSLLLNRSCSFT